jgi:hypothetical protein
MKFLILSLFIFSCAHNTVSIPNEKKKLVFPFGVYQHSVKVTFAKANNEGPKEFEFRGIFDFKIDKLTLVGLSPLGTSVFRTEENLITHDLKLEIYIPSSKQAEEKIKKSYIITRDVLTSSITDPNVKILSRNGKGMPLELEIPSQNEIVQVLLGSYDHKNIPKAILVSYKEFKMEVKVTSYEFNK